ncbi:MAG: NnrS family protein, partial [Nitrosomonadales bacterium]
WVGTTPITGSLFGRPQHLGYLAVIVQLLFEFIRLGHYAEMSASLSAHIFTFGAMGLIIPAMMIRISKGHTGRKVFFDRVDKLALYFMMLAFVMRIIAPQIYPASYAVWIALAASCWFACFAILGWRYIPILMLPRVDGREH